MGIGLEEGSGTNIIRERKHAGFLDGLESAFYIDQLIISTGPKDRVEDHRAIATGTVHVLGFVLVELRHAVVDEI